MIVSKNRRMTITEAATCDTSLDSRTALGADVTERVSLFKSKVGKVPRKIRSNT